MVTTCREPEGRRTVVIDFADSVELRPELAGGVGRKQDHCGTGTRLRTVALAVRASLHTQRRLRGCRRRSQIPPRPLLLTLVQDQSFLLWRG